MNTKISNKEKFKKKLISKIKNMRSKKLLSRKEEEKRELIYLINYNKHQK